MLVLTLESEALREVVRRRYVKNDEGEERWHNAIMKYFQVCVQAGRIMTWR